jgi:hypothetical protein
MASLNAFVHLGSSTYLTVTQSLALSLSPHLHLVIIVTHLIDTWSSPHRLHCHCRCLRLHLCFHLCHYFPCLRTPHSPTRACIRWLTCRYPEPMRAVSATTVASSHLVHIPSHQRTRAHAGLPRRHARRSTSASTTCCLAATNDACTASTQHDAV